MSKQSARRCESDRDRNSEERFLQSRVAREESGENKGWPRWSSGNLAKLQPLSTSTTRWERIANTNPTTCTASPLNAKPIRGVGFRSSQMAATKMIHPPNKNRKLITFIRLGNQKSQKHTDAANSSSRFSRVKLIGVSESVQSNILITARSRNPLPDTRIPATMPD